MTTEPEAIPADVLEPCPFCGVRLERGMHKRRNRDGSFAYMCAHPDVEPRCVASSVVVWAGERESEDAWNRRASRAPVDGAEAKPDRWELLETLDGGSIRWSVFEHRQQAHNAMVASDFVAVIRPLYTHPAPASPDAEMVKRLGALAYHIQQTGMADKQDAELVLRAAEALSKHGGHRS